MGLTPYSALIEHPTSWAMEVQTQHRPEWSGNQCRYATQQEAQDAGAELASRWFLVDAWRAVPSTDPVNYEFKDGRSQMIARVEYCPVCGTSATRSEALRTNSPTVCGRDTLYDGPCQGVLEIR